MALQITLNVSEATVGDLIVVTANIGSFGTKLSDNVVYFDGIPGRNVNVSSTTISVIVPIGVDSGDIDVKVYKKTDNIESNSVVLTLNYKDEVFSDEVNVVDTSRFSNNTLGNVSVYSRDLGYSNGIEITDATSVVQNVLSIILTRKGERLFNPEFGCNIYDLLFALMVDDAEIETMVLSDIKRQVGIYEPRATIRDDLSYIVPDLDNNNVFIVLYIVVPGGSTKEIGVTISGIRKE